MKNHGLFCTLFLDRLKKEAVLDDAAMGRMATLSQNWRTHDPQSASSLWDSFMKQAVSYLEFVPAARSEMRGVYPLFEDYSFAKCIAVLYLIEPGADIDDTSVGRFYPAKLLAQLRSRNLNWGILTNGARWRLYSLKSSRPYEDYVELSLADTLENNDEAEYGLFERFFHRDSFIVEEPEIDKDSSTEKPADIRKCRLDEDKAGSEKVLDDQVKVPLLRQVDEVLQYLCNGFIQDTPKTGEDYTEEERSEFFQSAVKLLYRCLFFFYAEARRLLPSDPEKLEIYQKHSIKALCNEAHKFRWGKRQDTDQYDLWKHLKGLVGAVNDGDPEYGIMGYDGGLFDDAEEKFLGEHQLRNDFLARALYLLAYVEPLNSVSADEYPIPYEDLEVRHLGELYENILEWNVRLADADRIRRRTKKGVEILLASGTTKQSGDTLIRKGEVFFGESALERKQTGSYYTPEPLVRFINEKTIIQPLREGFDQDFRKRFNELLEQAHNGHDLHSRRGAAQSAAALVERFAEDEVLRFKVCDPAMGSGHFLVDAANQVAGLIVSLLEEIPDVDGFHTAVSSKPNHWRRKVTRHCLYGVDLNPLAVNLAKLSLWLNCFAIDRKLTFLDHHLRQGNSLIGIRSVDQLREIPRRRKDGKKKSDGQMELAMNLGDLSAVLAKAGKGVSSIGQMDEEDTERQKVTFQEAQGIAKKRLLPLAHLYTAYLMDGGIDPASYRSFFAHFALGRSSEDLGRPDLMALWESIEAYSDYHRFFHWFIEFPDVFGSGAADGFSATIGNPPWDAIRVNSKEFFSTYDPDFRKHGKQKANKVADTLMGLNPAIKLKWDLYCDSIGKQAGYFREPLSYSAAGSGDINTFSLFMERSFGVLQHGGHMGAVVPSGLYTDHGCIALRELMFNQSDIEFIYCFENRWPTVFTAVDGRFKFILFGTGKGGKTKQFKCAFMQHDPERLPEIEVNALGMTLDEVRKFSPDSLSIMEFNSQPALDITAKIYGDWPLLGATVANQWSVKAHREIHMTDDSRLFIPLSTPYPLYEVKMIWLFDSEFEQPRYWLDAGEVEETLGNGAWEGMKYRLGFRSIAAGTNERTFIVSILPRTWSGNSINVVRPYDHLRAPDAPDEKASLWLNALFGSFCLDFLIRQKVTNNISHYYLYTLPVPRSNGSTLQDFFYPLVARALRLLCDDPLFEELWKSVFDPNWQFPAFWYPPSDNSDYGPTHEQEIRRKLADSASQLTTEWGPLCGVHDRLPDRRDTGDRAQLRAEIDAYVAHLYGLRREDFSYILDTFPVLRRKEEAAFGEFMSKRKCLEEYDRIGRVLGKKC